MRLGKEGSAVCFTLCSEADSLGQGTIIELPEQHQAQTGSESPGSNGKTCSWAAAGGACREAPIAKQLAHWDQWPRFKLSQYLGHLEEAVLGGGGTGYFPLCRGGDRA